MYVHIVVYMDHRLLHTCSNIVHTVIAYNIITGSGLVVVVLVLAVSTRSERVTNKY